MSATTKDWVKCPDCSTTWDTKRQPYNECPVCSVEGHNEGIDAAINFLHEWNKRGDYIQSAGFFASKLATVKKATNPTPVSVGGESASQLWFNKIRPDRKGRFLSGEQCLALDAELGPFIEASEFLMLEAQLSCQESAEDALKRINPLPYSLTDAIVIIGFFIVIALIVVFGHN